MQGMRPLVHRSHFVALCAGGFVLLTLGAQLLQLWVGGWQFDRVAYAQGAWWQLFSSQWVHLGWAHAAANMAALLLMLLALHRWVSLGVQGLALLGGFVGVAAVLALDTACQYYAGASGALHGMLAGSALAMLLAVGNSVRLWNRSAVLGALVLLGLGAKLLVQQGDSASAAPGWLGLVTYYPAHTAGAAGGLLAAVLAVGLRLVRRRTGLLAQR